MPTQISKTRRPQLLEAVGLVLFLDQPAESPGEPISGHVNQDFVAKLTEKGHAKDPAEKALFMTQNASVEAAETWLEAHKADPDFAEPLFIVKPDAPKLTPEEAKKKAKELQAKIRENRAKKDKESELEGEILRLKMGKGLTDAQRQMEEMQVKLDMERRQREKADTEKARQKILDEIEKDRRERGLKPKAAIRKPVSETFPDTLRKMQKVYPDPSVVKTCLSTICIYLGRFFSPRQLHQLSPRSQVQEDQC